MSAEIIYEMNHYPKLLCLPVSAWREVHHSFRCLAQHDDSCTCSCMTLRLSDSRRPARLYARTHARMLSPPAGVLVGAIAYTYNDIFFSPRGYVWVGLWYALCVVDSVIMKHVADTVPMTTWSRTYYNVRVHAVL